MPTTIADLTAACGEKILNPDFLLKGGEQPFAVDEKVVAVTENANNSNSSKAIINNNNNQNGTAKSQAATIIETKPIEASTSNAISSAVTTAIRNDIPQDEVAPFEFLLKRPIITLYSQKMKGLKDLLLAEKLNTQAISLQVTAQSVASKKIRGIDKMGHHTTQSIYASVNVAASGAEAAVNADSIAASRPKRTRRE